VISVKAFGIIQVQDGEGAHQSRQEVCAVKARKGICYALECYQRLRESQPVSLPESHFLDDFTDVLVNMLVNDLLLNSVNVWVLLFKLHLFRMFFFDALKCHSNIIFSLSLEIEESVRSLKLIQIHLNIVVVVNILLKLSPPLTTLQFIHEIFTVHVVEVDSDLRSKICLNASFLIKIKPKFFDFDGHIIHVGPQFSEEDVSFYCKTQCLLISNLNDDLIVIIIDIELKTAVVNSVLVGLGLGFAQVLDLRLPVNPPLNEYFNEWL